MKIKLILLASTLISVSSAYAQKRVVENASNDARLIPATGAKPIDDKKPCAVFNKSTSRTISVRVEESVMLNNFLQKKIIAIEKIGPQEQKFVGYAGCDVNVIREKCVGYKITTAYYEDSAPVPTPKPEDKIVRLTTSPDGSGITAK